MSIQQFDSLVIHIKLKHLNCYNRIATWIINQINNSLIRLIFRFWKYALFFWDLYRADVFSFKD